MQSLAKQRSENQYLESNSIKKVYRIKVVKS